MRCKGYQRCNAGGELGSPGPGEGTGARSFLFQSQTKSKQNTFDGDQCAHMLSCDFLTGIGVWIRDGVLRVRNGPFVGSGELTIRG